LVIQERNGSNTPTVSYTRGVDLSGSFQVAGGIGGLLARSHGYSGGNWSTHNYYHADGGGNVTYIINASQAMVAIYKYDPYGKTLISSGTLAGANVYRFSSKEIHVNSGLYYYGFRFYDPNLQRWLNRDPIGEEGGINLYVCFSNNPLSNYDPTGLYTAEEQACLNRTRKEFVECVKRAQNRYSTMLMNVLGGYQGCLLWCADRSITIRPLCYLGCKGLLASGLTAASAVLVAGLDFCAIGYRSGIEVCLRDQPCRLMVGPRL
jgi:RHS repeat-associated protein